MLLSKAACLVANCAPVDATDNETHNGKWRDVWPSATWYEERVPSRVSLPPIDVPGYVSPVATYEYPAAGRDYPAK